MVIISDRWESKAYILGTCDFVAQISDIKFWKGDENLRPADKKTVFGLFECQRGFVIFVRIVLSGIRDSCIDSTPMKNSK